MTTIAAPHRPVQRPHILPPAPASFTELHALFGDPINDPDFEEKHIVRIPLTLASGAVAHVACHELIAPRLASIFQEVAASKQSALIQTYDGCFNIRKVRGGRRQSLHSWGLAIDINAAAYPLSSTARQSAALQLMFRKEGFFYGANFKRPDPMHWQFTHAAL